MLKPNPLIKSPAAKPDSDPNADKVPGDAPKPQMAPDDNDDDVITTNFMDNTMDEISAGRQAADDYAARRKAELDLGAGFEERRQRKISGK